MTSEARLLAFESWMNAALHSSDWLAPLRHSATLLGARSVAMIWSESRDERVFLSASPDAHPPFLRLCSTLAKAHGAGVFEKNAPGIGQVIWTKVISELAPAGELLFAALFDGSIDQDLFRKIAACAASGVGAKMRLASERAASALKTDAFDQLPFGVVIVDRHMRIAEPNETCRQIFSRSDGLSVVNSMLLCREPSDQAAVEKAIGIALSGETNAGVIKVRRRGGTEPYVVRVVAPRAGAGAPAYCLLMIVDPDEEASPCGDIWREMFDLTDCELVIAKGLVLGRRIHEIATQRGVSIETVRTQTKRMFERLNVSSQAGAAARLSRTAPFRLTPAERRGAAEKVA